jgi:hypothetical protein
MPRNQQPPIIDLGTPIHMVGHTGYVRLTGGGRCRECKQVFATLLQNGLCAGCAGNQEQPPTGPLEPLDGKPRQS